MVNTSDQNIVRVVYVPATKIHDAVALTVSGGATPSVTSSSVDVAGASYIAISVINGNSTSMDAIVYASYDNTTFDTLAYASLNLGATSNKTLVLQPGPARIKVKITNNDAANATTVTVGLNITYI